MRARTLWGYFKISPKVQFHGISLSTELREHDSKRLDGDITKQTWGDLMGREI